MIKYPRNRKSRNGEHWICRAPVISTCHFMRDDVDGLESDAPWITMMSDSGNSFMANLESVEGDETLSAVFKQTCQTFKDLGYTHIIIDPDGDVIPGLPKYDW